jgi:hypothetical protein
MKRCKSEVNAEPFGWVRCELEEGHEGLCQISYRNYCIDFLGGACTERDINLVARWDDKDRDENGPRNLEIFPEDVEDMLGLENKIGIVTEEPLELELEECVICGCTEDHACEEGCHWVAPGLCSACAEKMEGVFKHIITSVGKDPRGTPFAPNVHHTQEEMEYLVRYQVQEWPYERVAAEYHVDVERVKKVCKEISTILGMQLRGES